MARTIFFRRKGRVLCSVGLFALIWMSWELISWSDVHGNSESRGQMSENFEPAILIATRQMHSTIDLLNSSNPLSLRLLEQTETLRSSKTNSQGVHATIKPGKTGLVNIHLWGELCGEDLRTLLYFPLFPNIPSTRKLDNSLKMAGLGRQYGKRVFGFIIAPETTSYALRIEVSGSAEFWLSSDEKPRNSKLIASINAGKEDIKTTITPLTKMEASKMYFFDLLHKHGISTMDFLSVQWKIGDGSEPFQEILSIFLKSFQDDADVGDDTVNFNSFVANGFEHSTSSNRNTVDKILQEKVLKFPFMDEGKIQRLFKTCVYEPNYRIASDRKLELFASKWETPYTAVFPPDNSNRSESTGIVRFGNDLIEESEAKEIVVKVIEQIETQFGRQYQLKDIVNVEKKESRFLVEVLLLEASTGALVRFSEYVYQQNTGELCFPEGFVWNKTSMVNLLVVSGRNQAKWVYHFIQNVQRIQAETGDQNINVIIVDFLSPNADLKMALEHSRLPHYMLFENVDGFKKSLAIQQGVHGGVLDPDSIVAVMDLHLEVPATFIEDVRKHTLKGLQAFSPVLERLECGSMPHGLNQYGSFWEFHGFGIVGIYKSDWDRFGGMNYRKFKDKWGGEDVEMADRILMAGMELERRKVVNLLHYFHTKKGMWNNSNK